MRRLVSRVLDGPHPWGEFQVGVAARGAWCTYRLMVLPPGVDATGRRLMRLRLAWPAAGALLGFLVLVAGAGHVGPLRLTSCVVTGYIASTLLVLRATRRIARTTLRISAAEYRMAGDAEQLGDVRAIREAVAAFERLDRAALDPVAYEAGWWRIYARLADEPSGSRRAASGFREDRHRA
ncbi:DUF6611 family protein [Pseudolysinimonas sp.]|uniref:DUF6611 family protein n=1 Tax=Pseudolysinimonas sp. TaxID=2680009 RepID=UPI003F7EBDA5